MSKAKMLTEYRTLFTYDVTGTSARKALREWQRQTNKERKREHDNRNKQTRPGFSK